MRIRSFRPAAAAAAFACALAVCTLPTAALAQAAAPVGALSLPQALLAARENLDVTLARQGVLAARADILAANRAPYPVASARASQIDLHNGIGGGNLLTGKRIEKYIGLDWTYERGNKRELRTAAAQRLADAAEAELTDIRVQQQLGALGAWVDLLAAQERLGEVQEVVRSASSLAEIARRRVSAGDLAAQDQSRAEIEAQRAASDLRGAGLERDRAAVVLGVFLGSPAPLGLRAEGGWPALDDARRPAVDIPVLVEQRADVRAADARLAAAQALFQGALATRKADVTVGASAGHYPGTSTALVELRVQMPLFWGYYQQGEIARAQAQLSQAESYAARLRIAASAELQRLRQEALSAAARARSYETDILPRARRVAEQAEFAFKRGALSLTDVLDARRTLRTTLIEALAARAEYARADGAWQLRTQPTAFGLPEDATPVGTNAAAAAAAGGGYPPGATPLPVGGMPSPAGAAAARPGAAAAGLGSGAAGAAATTGAAGVSPAMPGQGLPGPGASPAPGASGAAGAALRPGAEGVPPAPDAVSPDTPLVLPPAPALPTTVPGAAPAGAGAGLPSPARAPSPRPGDAAAIPSRGR